MWIRYSVDHLVLDGNRSARIGSAAYQMCKSGGNTGNRYGYNAQFLGCANCSLSNSASINGLCGTGFEWTGDDAQIRNNRFQANGNHFDSKLWADGLTLLKSDRAIVTNNTFAENSDVSFIFGGGINASITGNIITQAVMTAFAGLMMDNFNGGTPGDFRGTVVSANSVQCNNCVYGVNIGPHAWYPSANLIGGNVSNNYIRGGSITFNIDGAGTSANPLVISGNDLGPYRTPYPRYGCSTNARFNVSPDSVVSSAAPDTTQYTHGCIK